jgi:uncharacterized membrane protein YgcG
LRLTCLEVDVIVEDSAFAWELYGGPRALPPLVKVLPVPRPLPQRTLRRLVRQSSEDLDKKKMKKKKKKKKKEEEEEKENKEKEGEEEEGGGGGGGGGEEGGGGGAGGGGGGGGGGRTSTAISKRTKNARPSPSMPGNAYQACQTKW